MHFKSGEICLDILKTAWSPAWTLQAGKRAGLLAPEHPRFVIYSETRGSTAPTNEQVCFLTRSRSITSGNINRDTSSYCARDLCGAVLSLQSRGCADEPLRARLASQLRRRCARDIAPIHDCPTEDGGSGARLGKIHISRPSLMSRPLSPSPSPSPHTSSGSATHCSESAPRR